MSALSGTKLLFTGSGCHTVNVFFRRRGFYNMVNGWLGTAKSGAGVRLPCSRPFCEQAAEGGEKEAVTIVFVKKSGERLAVRAEVGDNLLFVARKHGVEMEGACEASLACTTCHVYVDEKHADQLQPPSEREEDMLDLAPFLKSTSRLGCQIVISKQMDGMVVTLPPATRNFYVDGHTPAAH